MKEIPMFKVATDEHAAQIVGEALSSGMLGEGPKVELFTDKLRDLFECKNVIPLNSCTSALTLALRLCGVSPSDTVISTPFTMVATNCAISNFTSSITWADIDPKTLAIDVDKLIYKNDRAKAIVLTLVGGIPPQHLDALRNYCDQVRIPLILDCAHALTTKVFGRHISYWGDICCFSTQSIKHLSTGDGGAITIRDDAAYDKALKLKWFGMSRIVPPGLTRLQHQMSADVPEYGYKFHMNDIAASLGLANFDLALKNIDISVANANFYQSELIGVDGIDLLSTPHGSEPSWWVYGFLADKRQELISHLSKRGIICTPMWRRNDEYSTFTKSSEHLPGMDKVQDRIIFIPSGFWVDASDRKFITESIAEFYK